MVRAQVLFERDFQIGFQEVLVAVDNVSRAARAKPGRGGEGGEGMGRVEGGEEDGEGGEKYSVMPTSRASSISSPLRCFCSQ